MSLSPPRPTRAVPSLLTLRLLLTSFTLLTEKKTQKPACYFQIAGEFLGCFFFQFPHLGAAKQQRQQHRKRHRKQHQQQNQQKLFLRTEEGEDRGGGDLEGALATYLKAAWREPVKESEADLQPSNADPQLELSIDFRGHARAWGAGADYGGWDGGKRPQNQLG